jgi:dolichol-phosphate mannosyltransferase
MGNPAKIDLVHLTPPGQRWLTNPAIDGTHVREDRYATPYRCLVILPTFNEAGNVVDMVAAIGRNLEADILVVDDNSPDGTGDLADDLAATQPHVHVLHRTEKQGLGPAYLAGFRWGLDRGFERLLEMDCDFSHDPKALPSLVRGCDSADLALGSRYVKSGRTRGWTHSRRFVSRCANLYSRLLLGMPVRDSTGGFRCYTADILRRIGPQTASARGYAFQVQMTWLVRRAGGSILEVPIEFTERRCGESKMSLAIALEALAAIPSLRVKSWLKSRLRSD